jgi:hypothetical protein
VVQAIVDRADVSFVSEFVQSHEWVQIDRDLMRRAIERDAALYDYAHPIIRDHVDILTATIRPDTATTILQGHSVEWLLEHTAFVQHAITVGRPLSAIAPLIPDEVWRSNRDVPLAWIRRGGLVLPSFEDLVQTDQELACAIAEHVPTQFTKVGAALRSDTTFMAHVLENVSGQVLPYAEDNIRSDIDMVIRSCSHADGLFPAFLPPTTPFTKDDLLRHVQDQLALHNAFVRYFVCGIALSDAAAPQQQHPPPPLSLLHQDAETSTALQQSIAAFVGLPVGGMFSVYRKARDNLLRPISPPVAAPTTGITPTLTMIAELQQHRRRRELRAQLRNRPNAMHDLGQLAAPHRMEEHGDDVLRAMARRQALRDRHPPRRPAHLRDILHDDDDDHVMNDLLFLDEDLLFMDDLEDLMG